MKEKIMRRLSSVALALLMIIIAFPAAIVNAGIPPIAGPVKFDISAPKCGAIVETIASVDDSGPMQTNAPIIKIHADCNYEQAKWNPSVSWINGKNDDIADEFFYNGKLEGGKSYVAMVELEPKDGYTIPDIEEEDMVDIKNIVTVIGGEVLSAHAYSDKFTRILVSVPVEHDWDNGTVTKQPTSSAEGVRTYKCKHCNATKTSSIARLPNASTNSKVTPIAKMTAGKRSLTIAWDKVEGADGYDIFFARCNHNKKKIVCSNVKSIEGNNTFAWTNSGLKPGTSYKAYVKAYVMRDGKKTYIKTTPTMHAFTGNGNKKYTNAKSVTVKKSAVTLNLKKTKTHKIKAKVNKVKRGKRLMPKGHAPTLRYMTSDGAVATVNAKGKITAKGKGTCYITVYAHNGVSKKVKVTVK